MLIKATLPVPGLALLLVLAAPAAGVPPVAPDGVRSARPTLAPALTRPKLVNDGLPKRWIGAVASDYENPVVFTSFATVTFTLTKVGRRGSGSATSTDYIYRPSGKITMNISGGDGSCSYQGSSETTLTPQDGRLEIVVNKRKGRPTQISYYGDYVSTGRLVIPTTVMCVGSPPSQDETTLSTWFQSFAVSDPDPSRRMRATAKTLEGTVTDVGSSYTGKWKWCLARNQRGVLGCYADVGIPG